MMKFDVDKFIAIIHEVFQANMKALNSYSNECDLEQVLTMTGIFMGVFDTIDSLTDSLHENEEQREYVRDVRSKVAIKLHTTVKHGKKLALEKK